MTKKKVVYKSDFFRIKLSDLQMHMFRKNKKWVELTIINARNLTKKILAFKYLSYICGTFSYKRATFCEIILIF